jgi:geranylgeranyl reductase family protein
MKLACDLLVVGMGPAGGSAALAAAARGLSVLAVERQRAIGIPVQCAEFVPLPMGRWTRAEGVLQQRIAGMNTFLPSGAAEHTDFPGLMIDRAAFDQAIARDAERAGAHILLGARLVGLDAKAHLARIALDDGEAEVSFKLAVAADGPRSRVAETIGLPALATVDTRQYTVPLRRAGTDTDIWLSDAYPGGYAWLFPKGEVANLGLGADRAMAPDLKAPLERLHARLAEQGIVGREVLARTGGAIPVGGLRERLVVGPVLLVGDAAGLTHPITGAGIPAAVISGDRAGAAAAELIADGKARALADFEEDVRDHFEDAVARAVRRRSGMRDEWGAQGARADVFHRRGWIAFADYFSV